MKESQAQEIRHLFRDAAALARVVAPLDFAGGLTPIPEQLATGVASCCIGPGDELARQHGIRSGVAFLFDVRPLDWLAGQGLAREVHRIVLHEAAHLVTLPAAAAEVVAAAVERLHDRSGKSSTVVADQHDARWAVAYYALAARAVPYRPTYGVSVLAEAGRDVGRYGHDKHIVAHHAERLAADKPLRGMLEAGGPIARLLQQTLPGSVQRAAVVSRAGYLTATGAA